MNKNLRKFKHLKIFINIIYFIIMLTIWLLISEKWFELEIIEFCLRCFAFVLIIYILHFFSTVWHEVGHLLFGIKAKLKFVSFNVLGFSIIKQKNV